MPYIRTSHQFRGMTESVNDTVAYIKNVVQNPKQISLSTQRIYQLAGIVLAFTFLLITLLSDGEGVSSSTFYYSTRNSVELVIPEPKPVVSSVVENCDECRDLVINAYEINHVCPITTKNQTWPRSNDFEEHVRLQVKHVNETYFPFEDYIANPRPMSIRPSGPKRNHTSVLISNALCFTGHGVNQDDITVTTQMSVSKMKRLSVSAQRYQGPISVTVRLLGAYELEEFQESVIKYAEHLQMVSFHLYFENEKHAYPQNLLRNIALDGVKTDYFIVLDVDLFTSPMNTHAMMKKSFKRNPKLGEKLKNKHIFVLPSFDTVENVPDEEVKLTHPVYPETKEMAIEYMKEGPDQKIEIFHIAWAPCQRTTNYPLWITSETSDTYPVVLNEWGYEPYIMGAVEGLPRFWPYFRGFGLDKLSFTTELDAAGYQFEVLRDFFIFHVNHPSSYGSFLEVTEKVNLICIKEFMEHIRDVYGKVGENEVGGWEKWIGERDKGKEFRNEGLQYIDITKLDG